jgi:hypothetical protein
VTAAKFKPLIFYGQETSFISIACGLPVVSAQPPVQWVPGALFLGLKHRGLIMTTHQHLVSKSRMMELNLLTYLLTPWPESASELSRLSDRRMSAKLVPTSADRECHVLSVTDPYGRILEFLDRTCCVNPIDNTHLCILNLNNKNIKRYIRILY